MNAPHRLQLQLRESRVEFTADRLELLTVVGHIYKPFVVGDFEHALPDLNTVIALFTRVEPTGSSTLPVFLLFRPCRRVPSDLIAQ